jgi:uncharacterized membrane protein
LLATLLLGVLGLDVFALALILLRRPWMKGRFYRPMLLNLALCAVPFVILATGLGASLLLLAGGLPTWVVVLVLTAALVVWLLMLPNAAYLVTELNLNHRLPEDPVPLWYDIVLVLSLALAGLLTTVLNVFLIQVIYAIVFRGDQAESLRGADVTILGIVLLVLVALGMYLGRYMRLNSWDVRRPSRLVAKIFEHARRPGGARDMSGFVVLHTVLLLLIHFVVTGPIVQGLISAGS